MKRLLPLLLALLVSACAPTQQFLTDALNEVGQSHGVLVALDDAIVVVPGETSIHDARLEIRGNELVVPNAACLAAVELVVCRWETLSEPEIVSLAGESVSATITYKRPGDAIYRHEIMK